MILINLFLLFGCTTHTVKGNIESASQQSIVNASCTLFDVTATTDSNGTYAFNGLKAHKGDYPIQCTASGFQFYEGQVSIKGSSVTLPSIVLEPLNVQIPYLPINLDPESELLPSTP